MTNLEFQAEQSKLGLTNEQAAKLCRVSIRTVEKWRQGTRAVPGLITSKTTNTPAASMVGGRKKNKEKHETHT